MQDVAGAVHDGAGPDLRDLAVALDFAGAVGDDQEFLFRVPMRRMGLAPGSRTPCRCTSANWSVGPL